MTLNWIKYPEQAGFKTHGTSSEAAYKITKTGRAATLRSKVLDIIQGSEFGMTADEVATWLNENVLSIRPRLSELRSLNLIKESGERRKNQSGMTANVWVKS